MFLCQIRLPHFHGYYALFPPLRTMALTASVTQYPSTMCPRSICTTWSFTCIIYGRITSSMDCRHSTQRSPLQKLHEIISHSTPAIDQQRILLVGLFTWNFNGVPYMFSPTLYLINVLAALYCIWKGVNFVLHIVPIIWIVEPRIKISRSVVSRMSVIFLFRILAFTIIMIICA